MQTAHLVYPGAKYTRKEHSLGVMHLSNLAILHLLFSQSDEIRREISPLQWGRPIIVEKAASDVDLRKQDYLLGWWDEDNTHFLDCDRDEIIQSVRLAGLLHDIGHGPFSHLLEEACREHDKKIKFGGQTVDFHHEKMTQRIIEEKADELGLTDEFGPDHICPILDDKGKKRPTFIHEIISSGYDCDKLDYLMRDSYHSGTREYGFIDYERIISGFVVKDGELRISKKAIDALMNSFDAIQYMYSSVYYHKTVRIFDLMVLDAFSAIPDFLEELISNLDFYLKFDDNSLIAEVRHRAEDGDADYRRACAIFNDFLNRKKRYAEIFEHRCSFGITFAAMRDKRDEEFRKIKRALNDVAGDLKIKVDYAPDIRPIGLKAAQILGWLIGKVIFDPKDNNSSKTIEEVSKAYFNKLTKYVILFRVYADKEQHESGKYDGEEQKVKDLAQFSLTELEKEYSRF